MPEAAKETWIVERTTVNNYLCGTLMNPSVMQMMKVQAFTQLKRWIEWVELHIGRKIKILGLDGGGEFGQATTFGYQSELNNYAQGRAPPFFPRLPRHGWINDEPSYLRSFR